MVKFQGLFGTTKQKDLVDHREARFRDVHSDEALRELHSRLKELPPSLEDLYANILENLDDKYLDHASRLFQIA
ncbi:hypothetical protein QBC36DRAFT_303280 [Triangularia setosa]|uniref:Uncharacterized protein n=1 Tax=Triangularia setosa TaxID=2587417 RepID=A0AAN7A5D1_9PEZI|nr:hypothetical protein QBC36DRAFT_303280 [Podospora setosa]